MATAKQSTEAVEKIREQPLVDDAWVADRGYVIAVLYRPLEEEGSIFQLIDLAKHLDMDGEIRIETEWLHEGEKRDTVHFEHVDRVEERI